MSVFITIVQMGLKITVRYGGWFYYLLTPVGGTITLYLTILVFTTVYRHNSSQTILDYNLPQMLWYTAASGFIWFWTFNFADRRIAGRIMDGDLSQDLLRPVSIFVWELGNAVSNRITGLIFEFIPALLTFSLILGADFLQPLAVLRFCLAAAVAFMIVFSLKCMVGLLTLYIPGARAMIRFNNFVIAFLAGAFIPLEFFPGWVQGLLNSLPFAYVFYWPIQFFLNRGAAGAWETFLFREAIALLWVAALLVMCQWLWQKAVRQYTDVGG